MTIKNKSIKNKLVIILLGPPGSGKGTQSQLLSEKFGLYYFETSRIIERAVTKSKKGEFVEVAGKKYYFAKQKELWTSGILCQPPFVVYLVKEKIKELYNLGENLALSGSPRTVYEVENLMPFIEKLYGKKNIKIVLMEVSAKESIFRNSHRRICALMRHSILYSKETKGLKKCPLDGSKLLKRKGLDNPETIKVRLEEYKERTLPIIESCQKKGFQTRKINGEGSVALIFERILKALK